ncbi:hypothetical protein IV203_030374 [Nitzschia inconspicua]|uniref:Uncharacterized protein n=1 Tax=Nitzschia inconspicua TaxID=303405 RepID=A0A9K3LSF6_9STRA|nr:hypothetical protein IV203_030374 [Nitzschia inconspicua]
MTTIDSWYWKTLGGQYMASLTSIPLDNRLGRKRPTNLIDRMEQSSDKKLPILRAAADYMPNDPRGIGVPTPSKTKTGDHPFGWLDGVTLCARTQSSASVSPQKRNPTNLPSILQSAAFCWIGI